jgi:uncharacterized membrane protein YphA (DoxX/SURF4 family)
MKKNTILEIISIWFVVLFLYTGISKLMDYSVFREQIGQSPVLKPFAAWIAWMLPLGEFAVAVLLFLPHTRLKGMYATLCMMTLFTLYIGAILTLDDHIPCSCGGVIELLSWKGHLIFNGICIGLAASGILLQRTKRFSHAHSI